MTPAVRTRQTAYALGLARYIVEDKWLEEPLASERSWGKKSTISHMQKSPLKVEGDILNGRPGPDSIGSESLMELRNDAAPKLIKKLGEFALGKTVVLVGHGEMMGVVAAEIMDLDEDQWREQIKKPMPSIGKIPNGGIIEFRAKKGSEYLPSEDTEIRISTPAGPDREYSSGWLNREEFINQ